MLKKLKVIIWFLKNPKYFPHFFQMLKRKMNKNLENTRDESTSWCKNNSVTKEIALQNIIGVDENKKLVDIFPNIMQEATIEADNCPFEMGGEGAISFLYNIVHHTAAKNILETGVAYGWSSLAILLAIRDKDGAQLISNDMPYINMGNDDFVGCVVPENLRSKWDLQRLPDIKGIPLALTKFKHSLDICHYDSDKSYIGRMWSSPLLWDALKPGGYFISDDINDNIAFKYFCEQVNRTPIIIEHQGKYVGVIKK